MDGPWGARSPGAEGTGGLTLAYDLTLDDYMALFGWSRRRPEVVRALLRRWAILIATVPAASVTLGILVGWGLDDFSASLGLLVRETWVEAVEAMGFVAVVITAVIGSYWLTYLGRTRKALAKQLRGYVGVDPADPELRQSATLVIDDEGIRSRTAASEIRLPWATVQGLDETDHLVLPRFARSKWVIVPKRCVGAGVLEEIRRMVRDRTERAEA